MDEFQKQLILLVLDKGLLALIIGAFGFLAKRHLDRQAAQRAYSQRLAEERIRAYKEVSRIVAEQFMIMARIPFVLQRSTETEAEKEKITTDFMYLYNRLVESYFTDMPKLQADIIFMCSSEIVGLLITYIDVFGGYMRIPGDLAKGIAPTPPDEGIMVISAKLSHALSEEITHFRV